MDVTRKLTRHSGRKLTESVYIFHVFNPQRDGDCSGLLVGNGAAWGISVRTGDQPSDPIVRQVSIITATLRQVHYIRILHPPSTSLMRTPAPTAKVR